MYIYHMGIYHQKCQIMFGQIELPKVCTLYGNILLRKHLQYDCQYITKTVKLTIYPETEIVFISF